jgi:hypothetical protein
VKKAVVVEASAAHAFEVFTAGNGERPRVELEHRDFERPGEEAGETMRGNVDGGWPHRLKRFAAEAAASGK